MLEVPTVAIILRTKNREIFFSRAVHSIINQTFTSYRVYIVNDGGESDFIEKTIHNLAADVAEKFVVTNMPESAGRGGALSIGLSLAREKYILIHDDDDTLEPNFLERTVAYLEDDKENLFSGVTTSNYDVHEEVRNNTIIINKKDNSRGLKNGTIIDYSLYLSGVGIIIPISLLFRRDRIKLTGNIDTNMNHYEDHDLFLRLMQYGEIGVIQDFLCSYHHRPSSGTSFDTSRHEKNYDYHVAYRNNIIRAGIANKSAIKTLQSHFIQGKTIDEYHTNYLLMQVNELSNGFAQMTKVMMEILKKIP